MLPWRAVNQECQEFELAPLQLRLDWNSPAVSLECLAQQELSRPISVRDSPDASQMPPKALPKVSSAQAGLAVRQKVWPEPVLLEEETEPERLVQLEELLEQEQPGLQVLKV